MPTIPRPNGPNPSPRPPPRSGEGEKVRDCSPSPCRGGGRGEGFDPDAPRPLALLAELTYRCPLKCPYCSNPLELDRYRRELDTATWQRVLAEAAALGVVQVHFSGGEPLVRRDLAELVEESARLGLYPHLSTGGTMTDEGTLARLRDAGLNALQISLLDARPAENDWLAGAISFD